MVLVFSLNGMFAAEKKKKSLYYITVLNLVTLKARESESISSGKKGVSSRIKSEQNSGLSDQFCWPKRPWP